ncbi:MAG: AzlC family ABC transporter permease [Clostridiales bacterium]|jgi:4-azaleucine resistance transporter AzlC|nr:AzlC family ABC transporter permease [Clostridiales bacterium]MCI2161961.1 AzlC family ABC transporter permease [Oscillospiraceae bacterium]MCI1962326.1 AzlC family ABC transporter permease [Clostridiales bacterium]MCI2022862.1 AzlC family ABC transporter permease [Clostridiales bacterium]MCI2027259.1 AzlC family ABC transporter permease [Clostridiales bacterium]
MEKIKRKSFQKAFISAFPHTVPVLTGFLMLGIAYGVLMQTKGYGTLWAVLMSAIAYCGSMQFVAITLLTVAFNPFQAFMLSLMVNARQLFYGISMLDKYKGLGKAKGFLIYTLCDETFSISSSITLPEGVNRKYFYLSISLLNYSYWVLGTALGGIVGNFITFNTNGLDFVLTALFVVLFLEQMKKKENRISGFIGLAGTIIGLSLFGANNVVIPSMLIILAILLAGRKKICC